MKEMLEQQVNLMALLPHQFLLFLADEHPTPKAIIE